MSLSRAVYLFGDFGGLTIGRMQGELMSLLDGADKHMYKSDRRTDFGICESVCRPIMLDIHELVAESDDYHRF